jgi:hypothetical protein
MPIMPKKGRAAARLGLLVLTLAGCDAGGRRGEVSIAQKLGEATTERTVDYVVRFESSDEAQAHARAVASHGGRVTSLNQEGTVQRVEGPAALSEEVHVSDTAIAARNTSVRLVPPAGPEAPSTPTETPDERNGDGNLEQAVLEALTVRSVTGVARLVHRIPEADGRGVKVAVFDTGIDFGVEGVSTDGKLEGFFDLTGFGKVATTPTGSELPQPTYSIDGRTLELPAAVGARRILATGLLAEEALARAYDIAAGVDLDGDEVLNDVFPFLIGEDHDGKPAVFIDVTVDGSIAADGSETLTDFNTTKRYLDLWHGAPSGGRPLAVTIGASGAEVQFHSVPGGHGTSCGVIIAGDRYADGRLTGLAPKATLVSYLLDADGQDVYTIDQLLAMFLHAKAQQVDAISISWGFATADLHSARFVADFLDREIASAGIVIAVAAGNAGPGLSSAAPDDYVPHHGLAVGAMISEAQAQNVYGWTGATGDAMIWYTSIGPTRGGRLAPDAASPLMSFVRGERGTTPGRFYGFGGTSSATPALIGSVAALVSALKQQGEPRIEARLLKLALQESAHPVRGFGPLEQGAGVIDVDAAYDVYRRLAAELRAARQDTTRRTKFAYELRAETGLRGQEMPGEGLVIRGFQDDALVTVKLFGESATLVDPLTTLEPLVVTHQADFFAAPSMLALQLPEARFAVRFNPEALREPGVYTDVIELSRASDGLTLLRIPVAVTIEAKAVADGRLVAVDQTLAPFDIWRVPVELTEADEIAFDGVALDLGGNEQHSLGIHIYNELGSSVASQSTPLEEPAAIVKFRSPRLPAGRYELLVNRSFGRPAALGQLKLSGAFRLPKARLVAAEADDEGVSLAVAQRGRLALTKAELELGAVRQTTTLTRGEGARGRQGYVGSVSLSAAASSVELALRQSGLDRALESFLHVELVLLDAASGAPLHRGWHDLRLPGDAPEKIELARAAQAIDVLAYPNIVDWTSIGTERLLLDLDEPLATPVKLSAVPNGTGGNGERTVALRFSGAAPRPSTGVLRLLGKEDVLLDSIHIVVP